MVLTGGASLHKSASFADFVYSIQSQIQAKSWPRERCSTGFVDSLSHIHRHALRRVLRRNYIEALYRFQGVHHSGAASWTALSCRRRRPYGAVSVGLCQGSPMSSGVCREHARAGAAAGQAAFSRQRSSSCSSCPNGRPPRPTKPSKIRPSSESMGPTDTTRRAG
jgi:hypothetical protein